VSPNSGISLYTNFTITQEGWKGGAMPLLFRIKCKTKSNILIDISNGGFFSQNFIINSLPEGNNNIFLEVSDQQGRFVLSPCSVNVKGNNNLQIIENYITNIIDIPQKMVMMDILTLNSNENRDNHFEGKKEINTRIEVLNSYYKEISLNFNPERFYENIDKVLSFLLELSNKNLKDINFQNLYEILDLIINNFDPFIENLNKVGYLYRIIDNFSENIKIKRIEIKSKKYFY